MTVARMAMAIRVLPEKLDLYKELHAHPWPEMDAALRAAHIRNYSIYHEASLSLLFAHWDYTGSDFAADMAQLGGMDITRKWLALTDPCQESQSKGDMQ
jgi:L-rhamnose mutarotase